MQPLLPTTATPEKVRQYIEGKSVKADCWHRKVFKGSLGVLGLGVVSFAANGALSLLGVPMLLVGETAVTSVGAVSALVMSFVEWGDMDDMWKSYKRCSDASVLRRRAGKTCIELGQGGETLIDMRQSILTNLRVVSEGQSALAQGSIDAAITAYAKRKEEIADLSKRTRIITGEVEEGSVQAAFLAAVTEKVEVLKDQNKDVLASLEEMRSRAEEARCAVELARVVGVDQQLSLPQAHDTTLAAFNEWLSTYTEAWKDPAALALRPKVLDS